MKWEDQPNSGKTLSLGLVKFRIDVTITGHATGGVYLSNGTDELIASFNYQSPTNSQAEAMAAAEKWAWDTLDNVRLAVVFAFRKAPPNSSHP